MSDLLQARRARAKFASSQSMRLTSQAKQFIVEHRYLYLQGPNSLNALPNTIKLEILEMLRALKENNDAFELQCKVLILLINPTMTTFNFPPGVVALRNKEAATSVWNKLLAVRPSSLHTLVTQSPNVQGPQWNISLLVKESIYKFPHLQVLKVGGFACRNFHLCLIARKLLHLRVLDLELCPDFVTKKGFVALSKLQSLQEFTFTGSGAFDMIKATLWCFEYMPHLHVAGYKPDLDGDRDALVYNGELWSHVFARALRMRNLVLKLHFLLLENDIYLGAYITFPELRVMCLTRPSHVSWIIDLDQLPHLNQLGLFDPIDLPAMFTVLEKVGQRLTKLKFCVTELQLDTVLQLCPNLSELIVETSNLFPQQSQPPPLLQLQQLHIRLTLDVALSEPLLHPLRLAPNLRYFSLKLAKCNFNLVSRFVDLAREGSCMQKLQRINVEIATSSLTPLSEAHKQRYRDMLEGCANYLDHLHTVDVAFS